MSDILTEFSIPSILQAMESNLQELGRLWGRIIGATFYEDAESNWFISGLPFELTNNVFRVNIAEHVPGSVEKLIERLMAYRTPLSCFIGPSTQPANLGQRLLAHGWRLDDSAPGMALDLLALDENAPVSSKLRIEQADSGEMLEQWIRVVVAGSEMPGSVLDFALGLYHKYGFVSSPLVRCYLGLLDSEPVTCSLLFLAGGVAGIYNVATLPHARGQGFGTAITLASLLDARRLGYRFAILQSSPMGLHVYRRLDFQEYCTFSLYMWPGENGCA
ncbi:MAG: hypothetical protein WCD86_22745 [Ktedonobacteraceae bacterium]